MDYYEILEVTEKSSISEIKKSYKRLCLKYHPDKCESSDEEEIKKWNKRFQEIQEAYNILKSKSKRKKYDENKNSTSYQSYNNTGFYGEYTYDEYNTRKSHKKGTDISITVNIDIKDLFNRKKNIKNKVRYRKLFRCKTCNGKGCYNIEVCHYCNGTGWIFESGSYMLCKNCNGKGFIEKDICASCLGSKFISKEVEESFYVESWYGKYTKNYGTIILQGKGNESEDPEGSPGNLKIQIKVVYESVKYAIQGNDVYERILIPYYDMILGTSIKHELLSGEIVNIDIKRCTMPDDMIRLYDKGLEKDTTALDFNSLFSKNGDYVIVIEPEYPSKLEDKDIEILKQLKASHENELKE